ncbi:MAG: transcription-repair coupling factor [Defluviitaleaceae bacterium]|nr:transcription-repair coupling factor [Defluviitaleaceae bacterium]
MKHKAIINPLLEIESYVQVLEATKSTKTSTALCTGVVDGQKCHLAWALSAHTARPSLFITHSEAAAREITRDTAFFADATPIHFPVREYLEAFVDVAGKDVAIQRLAVLERLIEGGQPPIVASIDALFAPLSPKSQFTQSIMKFTPGDEINLDNLAMGLVAAGYNRAHMAEGHGQFAIRGGIIDIFPPNAENPIRIELWGDEIDSIRAIDAASQRSIDNTDGITIYPVNELLGDEKVTLLDYLPRDTIIFFDEPARMAQNAAAIYEEYQRFFEGLLEKGDVSQDQFGNFMDYETVLRATEGRDRVLLSLMPHNPRDFKPTVLAHFDTKSSAVFSGRIDLLVDDLQYLMSQNYTVLILAGNAGRARRLCDELTTMNFSAHYADSLDDLSNMEGRIILHHGNLSKGFEYPHLKLAVISGAEFFGDEVQKRRPRRKAARKKGAAIDSFTDLNVGDYIVHDNHGVGIYRGLEKVEIDGVFRDYLRISYHGESALLVAINQMDALQKYIGAEGAAPRINRLGGADWQKTKARARAAVEEVAKELVVLYAAREATKGHSYTEDTVWQAEFEESFIYEETEDQLTAVEDVKRDMESARVMDRLICGDVGYGKTEVAIRAAFKAVCDQKQVAYLCPTTILAQQHYNTFTQRMKDYPVNIDVLSRFRTAKEQRATLEKVKNGMADIVIGTHRLLSGDVEFKNLGLIVVDEEQRFGVLHKEKLKQQWENVDVMTLTATPIPRTLHMSLSGIRDMSLLEEPPHERRPIQTYVLEYSEEIVKSAILREISRGGQIYYLHNRVRNIAATADRIQKLVPEAQIAFAHGQMSETQLENVMMDFVDGAIDVLVCTTIIESGLDIPNVNTIIIQDADNMGLAQLYQLRGRVGRAGRSSFAYLMYRKDKVLTEVAEKRLQTIREFTEFGAGFKIAMRDLEIRGAGNILGAAQHGHMDAVGYEMYCKLLDMAVKEIRGIGAPETFETTVDIIIDAFIPEKYIQNEHQKLEIYKRISHIANETDFFDVQDEMLDRFGTLPPSAQNLLDIALLKARANAVDIISIAQKGRNIIITFKGDARVNPLTIGDIVAKSNGRLKFRLGTTPHLTYRAEENENLMPAISSIVLQLS